jgi:hypothetical protein
MQGTEMISEPECRSELKQIGCSSEEEPSKSPHSNKFGEALLFKRRRDIP